MNDPQSGGHEQRSADWAPFDYTDGKKKGEWKSEYPPDARRCIRLETAYLVALGIICLCMVFGITFESCKYWPLNSPNSEMSLGDATPLDFLGFVGALFAGMLGGCSFGLKCMYHFVAKRMWHEDRRLWRLISPPLSGVLSLFMVFLVASGLLQIFDSDFMRHPTRVMAFSFLVGYFSDKALAKMADVADTLFGGVKKEK